MQDSEFLGFRNGIEIEILKSGTQFLGIGVVRYDGCDLRSNALPWIIYAESETGHCFDQFELVDLKSSPDEVEVCLQARGRRMPRVQEADSMGDSRVRSRRLRVPVASFRWTFRAVEEQFYDNAWPGLAMTISAESPGHPMHWLLEDATWEIRGTASGCILIQQDIMAIDLEQRVERDSKFCTRECFSILTDGEWDSAYPMDMMPRGVGAAICDFQTRDDLAICLFSEKPGLTRTRLEKFTDEDVVHYTDRPHFALTEHITAPERKLIVYRHPQPLKPFEWRNLWLDCFTEVRRRIHEGYGFELQIPEPAIGGHLWDPQLIDLGPKWVDAMIEAFEPFGALGYKGLYTHGGWEGATTDPAAHGNICTPYAFRNDDAFGGPEGMRRLTDAAHQHGIEVFHWAGFQFSKSAPVWKDHKDWILKKQNGEPWDAGYQILQCGRMRSGFRNHIFEQLKTAKEETGLDGIFWDSYHNLGATCIDWGAPDKAPQLDEIVRFQVELQKLGYKHRCECVTIFGTTQVGMYSFEGDTFVRRSWEKLVANDEAFALLDASPAFHSHEYAYAAERVSPEKYFWLLAHRVVPTLEIYPWACDWDPEAPGHAWPGRELAAAYGSVNHLYNRALPRMHHLRLVDGGTHTVWLDENGDPSVIWAIQDCTYEGEGMVDDIGTGDSTRLEAAPTLQAGHVYFLEPAAVAAGA